MVWKLCDIQCFAKYQYIRVNGISVQRINYWRVFYVILRCILAVLLLTWIQHMDMKFGGCVVAASRFMEQKEQVDKLLPCLLHPHHVVRLLRLPSSPPHLPNMWNVGEIILVIWMSIESYWLDICVSLHVLVLQEGGPDHPQAAHEITP